MTQLAQMTPVPGDRGLQIEELVARSDHATVYRAILAGETVALKVAPAAGGQHLEAEARLEHEVGILVRIDRHPALPTLVDHGRLANGSRYLMTRWVPGVTAEAWSATGPRSWREVRPVITAVAGALAVLHRGGVVHRDVSPRNVMVTPAGAAVLIDLGHSHVLLDPRSTPTGRVAGTLLCLAPEQISGGTLTPRVDLYAVGVVLHRMLSGAYPRTAVEVMSGATRIPRLGPPVPPSVADLCQWMLAANPPDRLPSAHVLLGTMSLL